MKRVIRIPGPTTGEFTVDDVPGRGVRLSADVDGVRIAFIVDREAARKIGEALVAVAGERPFS